MQRGAGFGAACGHGVGVPPQNVRGTLRQNLQFRAVQRQHILRRAGSSGAGGVQLGKMLGPNFAVIGVVLGGKGAGAAAIVKGQGAFQHKVAEIRLAAPQQSQIIQHKLQIFAKGISLVKGKLPGVCAPVKLVPRHGDQAVQVQAGQVALLGRVGYCGYRGGIVRLHGVVPEHKSVGGSGLCRKGGGQSAGAQGIVTVQKYNILAGGGP